MTGYIYVHTNKINGKKYVGQTINPEDRWKYDGYKYKRCPKFWNAIKKYGWDNFEHEILIECPTQLLDTLEMWFIKMLDTYNNGYNSNLGGNGNKGHTIIHKENLGKYKHTKEQNQKIKENTIKAIGRKVECIETGQIFKTITDAEISMNKDPHAECIGKVCRGKRKSAYGYHWRYVE